jgi:haloalkane dehalogenase
MPRSFLWLSLALLGACQPISKPMAAPTPTPRSTPVSENQAAVVHQMPVLDSFMSYSEQGSGRPIVFLHGNPTSAYVWRKVLPTLAPGARCLAPDLIGMGHSGKPNLAYRYADQARYLDAWFAALDLHDAVLVGYDWGGVLAIDWASRHSERVRGVVVFETILQSMHWSEYPAQGAQLFRALRTPGVGEKMVLEQNQFLARSLEHGVKHGLSPAELAEYEAPFPDPASRRPMLQWTREIPIDDEPADVLDVVTRNARWLAETPRIPKLLLTFDGNAMSNAPSVVAWAKRTIPSLSVVPLGPAGHHAPEDAPREISRAIQAWLAEPLSQSAQP